MEQNGESSQSEAMKSLIVKEGLRQKLERLSAKSITFLSELLGWDDMQMDEERTIIRGQLEKTTFRR